jgi:hypothetical protein
MSTCTVHGSFNITIYTITPHNHSNDANPQEPFQHTGRSDLVIYHPYLLHNTFYLLRLSNKFNHETNLNKRKYFRAAKFSHYAMRHCLCIFALIIILYNVIIKYFLKEKEKNLEFRKNYP